MPRLEQQDLDILRLYAKEGNRELYWNYLAQKEGADGYGLLALGVVRNDSMPGAVANHFAANRAHKDGRVLSERDWEKFGEDLVRRDFALRTEHFNKGRTGLALNLPVDEVQRAHDGAFEQAGISTDAWTPRQLLEAARRHGGREAAEQVWTSMLNGRALGTNRGVSTALDVVYRYNDAKLPATQYLHDLGYAIGLAGADRDHTNPDIIGARNFYYLYDRRTGGWSSVTAGDDVSGPVIRDVTDARKLRELNETRAVRLESRAQRDDWHPQDPNRTRPIARSPFTLADAGQAPDADVRLAQSAGASRSAPAASPSGFEHPLYQQALAAISRRDAELGREPDDNSRNIAVASATLAARNGYGRIDDIVFNVATDRLAAGERFFVIERGANPEFYRRDSMSTTDALAMTPEQRQHQAAQIGALQAKAAETQSAQVAQDERHRMQAGPQLA